MIIGKQDGFSSLYLYIAASVIISRNYFRRFSSSSSSLSQWYGIQQYLRIDFGINTAAHLNTTGCYIFVEEGD